MGVIQAGKMACPGGASYPAKYTMHTCSLAGPRQFPSVVQSQNTQVLRYGPTNKYGPHIDGLERVATVLIYLVGE